MGTVRHRRLHKQMYRYLPIQTTKWWRALQQDPEQNSNQEEKIILRITLLDKFVEDYKKIFLTILLKKWPFCGRIEKENNLQEFIFQGVWGVPPKKQEVRSLQLLHSQYHSEFSLWMYVVCSEGSQPSTIPSNSKRLTNLWVHVKNWMPDRVFPAMEIIM